MVQETPTPECEPTIHGDSPTQAVVAFPVCHRVSLAADNTMLTFRHRLDCSFDSYNTADGDDRQENGFDYWVLDKDSEGNVKVSPRLRW